MGPDWLGSPQHVAGGAVVAAALFLAARAVGVNVWLATAFALGGVSTVEIVVELVEYPWLYPEGGTRAYFDTIADLAATLAGAIIGSALGAAALRAWRRTRRPSPE